MSDNSNEIKMILSAKNFSLQIGSRLVLKDITLNYADNKIHGILGPANSGKTALIKSFNGIYPSAKGDIFILGKSIKDDVDSVRKISGVATESAKLYDYLSLVDNLVFFGKISGYSGVECRDRASFLLHKFSMWDSRDTLYSKLSTENKRKALIVCALMSKPEVLYVDAITDDFSSSSKYNTNKDICDIASEEGIAVFVTSRDPESLSLCDDFTIIKDGSVVAQGDYDDLQKKAKVSAKAHIRVLENKLTLTGLNMKEISPNVMEADIESENDLAEYIKKAVYWGYNIVEAYMIKPTLADFYSKLIEDYE